MSCMQKFCFDIACSPVQKYFKVFIGHVYVNFFTKKVATEELEL